MGHDKQNPLSHSSPFLTAGLWQNGQEHSTEAPLGLRANLSYSSLWNFRLSPLQVCDSDTMLDPASSVEMVKVLEEDPMVGGVGGDVQVHVASLFL